METWNEALERYGKMYDKTLKFWKPCEKENKMTNREWLESLSDERIARLLGIEPCDNYCTCANGCNDECVEGIIEWLQSEHEEPKKEFTQDQLKKVFRDKFMERRAIGILEIEELIGELFR